MIINMQYAFNSIYPMPKIQHEHHYWPIFPTQLPKIVELIKNK